MRDMVVNVRSTDVEYDIYIGRNPKHKADGQTRMWGNPFSHMSDTAAAYKVGSRDEAIAAYKTWLWQQIKDGSVSLADLAGLHGAVLACHCKPLACHGDVLVAAAEWAAREQASRTNDTRGAS